MNNKIDLKRWVKDRIKPAEFEKYIKNGKTFLDESDIISKLRASSKNHPSSGRVKDILNKSLEIKTLDLDEVVELLHVSDPELLEEMRDTALKVKKKVYDNRIVTFAPLYLGSFCVNDCLYCGFRSSNPKARRKILTQDELKSEVETLAGKIGHKRLIAVYGEHPGNDIDYILETMRTIYEVKVKTRKGFGQIRRVNVNAPPFSIDDLKKLHTAGIGTYQVFQETYHRKTYETAHPEGTLKGDYLWRLYVMHRALEAGIDDVGLGVLFGLYDWRFEVLGLCAHNIELEKTFGIGAHTISFPRVEPSDNTPYSLNPPNKVSDEDFKKLILVIRLAVPHAGMIITARESASMRRESLSLGITQTDASPRIGVGGYSLSGLEQEGERQQFILGDTRSLDELIREFAEMGYITSFCTAGYRCGRTGKCIMDLLRSGAEGRFCKLNAVLTFREWIDDFASDATKQSAEKVIAKEIEEIKTTMPNAYGEFQKFYSRVLTGERDLYF